MEQMDRLLKFSSQDQNKDIHLFILIGLETSMRKMEILSIRLEHINLDQLVQQTGSS
jgi:integrase